MNAPNHGAHQRKLDKKPIVKHSYIKQPYTVTGTFRNDPVQRETEAGHLPAVLRMTALPPHGLHPATVFLFIKYINILKNSLSFCTVFSPRSKKIVCLLIRNNGLVALE